MSTTPTPKPESVPGIANRSRKRHRHKLPLEWREIAWRDTLTPAHATALLERLATSPELGQITLELRADAKGARWLVAAPVHRIEDLITTLEHHLPARLHTPRRVRREMTDVARLHHTGTTLTTSADRLTGAIRGLFAALTRLGTDERAVVQLTLGRRLSPGYWYQEGQGNWIDLLLGTPTKRTTTPARTSTGTEEAHGFRATVRLGVAGASPARSRLLLQQLYGAFRTLETGQARLRLEPDRADHLNHATPPWRWPLHLRSHHLPGLTGWPIGDPPLPLLGSVHPRLLAPTTDLEKTERVVGVTSATGLEERVGIPIRDALFHTHLLGPTGSGKSTVMLNLITADIDAGRGVLVIDPKGDLATDVLARIPKARHQDVVILDPTNSRPIGINPLAGPAKLAPVTADSLLGIFEALFHENWGIRTADTLTAAFLTLARTPGANLLWLTPLLTNPAFRRRVLKGHKDPLGTDSFWQAYDAKKPEQQAVEIAPVLNKLRQLILRPGLRAVLGQTDPQFDIDDLLKKRRIVIVNLNRGLLGADAAKLLGTLLLGQLWTRILARAAQPPERRHIVSIYIDEVHDFIAGIPGDLTDALAQARSLGAAFILANQYRAQLSPQMQQAIDANTRSKLVFGLGGTDAAAIAKTAPDLDVQDFMLLPKYHAYANLMQAGNATGWISITTRPPTSTRTDPTELVAASHDRYGIPANDTEQAILDLIQSAELNPPSDSNGGQAADTDGAIGRAKR